MITRTDRLHRVPVAQLTAPRSGLFDVHVDHWWSVTEDEELLFYRMPRTRGLGSPQCNADRSIAEKVGVGLYPMPTRVRQIPLVFVPVNLGDYV